MLLLREDQQLRSKLGQNPMVLQGWLHLLCHGSDAARYWCCQCIVSLSHKHIANQSVMAKHPGMMEAILEVLLHGSALSRGAACSALVESTFRNAENALLVAKTPGMMQGVVFVMQISVGDVRDDAAGVLRNCSNYSQEAAELIVQTPVHIFHTYDACMHNSCKQRIMHVQSLSVELMLQLTDTTRKRPNTRFPGSAGCAD